MMNLMNVQSPSKIKTVATPDPMQIQSRRLSCVSDKKSFFKNPQKCRPSSAAADPTDASFGSLRAGVVGKSLSGSKVSRVLSAAAAEGAFAGPGAKGELGVEGTAGKETAFAPTGFWGSGIGICTVFPASTAGGIGAEAGAGIGIGMGTGIGTGTGPAGTLA